MTTWAEARAAREERLRRERRYYTPDKLGAPCRVCHIKVPAALIASGMDTHPTCGTETPVDIKPAPAPAPVLF